MGRLIVLVVLCGYFLLLFSLGGHSSWNKLGVPDLSPAFLDMRSVTSGWECTRRGVDVLPLNSCDPLKRPANYPRLWMKLSFLGLGQGSTVALGLVTAVVFFAAALAVLGPRARPTDAAVYAAALCSPAMMLGIERGNVDLLLFALVVLAVIVIRRGRYGPAGASALILLASLLKLFPIFCVSVLARQRRAVALTAGAVVLALFGAYALATIGDIRTIGKVVPQADAHSYGVDIAGKWLAARLHTDATALDVLLVLIVATAGILVSRRLPRLSEEARATDAYYAGAAVYVCTFALFHSFDYRLVFLLLTIPQLVSWARERQPLAFVTLALLLATLWLDWGSALAAGVVSQLLLAGCLLAGLAATAPGLAPRRGTSPAIHAPPTAK